MTPIRILFLEGRPGQSIAAVNQLQARGMEAILRRVDNRGDFEAAVDAGDFDILIADEELPGEGGASTLDFCRRKGVAVPVIILSGTPGEEPARARAREEKAGQEELEEERRRFFNLSGDLLAIADLNGCFTQVNDSWERVLGYTREDLLAKPFLEFVHPEDREKTVRETQVVAEGSGTMNFENRYLAKDGSVRWFMWSSSVSLERKAIYAVARDITEKKTAEEAMHRAKERAEEEAKAKGRLLANMGHEIRTSMHAVVSMTGLLSESGPTARQEQFVKIIRASAYSLVRVIDDILDLSEMEQGKLELESRPFSLQELVSDAIAVEQAQAEERGVELRWSFSKGAPRMVTGDAGRLRQVLVNLIGHAVKFSSKGAVDVNVHSDAEEKSSVALDFEVMDTSKGTATEAELTVLRAFFESEDVDAGGFGSVGPGLGVVKQLATRMGGRIAFASQSGKGSCFRLALRLGIPDAAELSPRSWGKAKLIQVPDSAPHPSTAVSDSLRILIAEDNDLNQVVAASLLETLGHRVDVVDNGREALRAQGEKGYDLIFMDCQMPEMDGYTASARIRHLERKGRRRAWIVAMTADTSPGVEVKCLASGMDGYITKPIMMDSLREFLEKAAGRPASSGLPESRKAPLDPAQTLVAIDILNRLQVLSEGGRQGMFRDLVFGFLEQAAQHLEKMQELSKGRHYLPLARTAHTLKGMSLNFGALAMARESESIERLAGEPGRSPELEAGLENLGRILIESRVLLIQLADPSEADVLAEARRPGGG